jgi:hypothetical protein
VSSGRPKYPLLGEQVNLFPPFFLPSSLSLSLSLSLSFSVAAAYIIGRQQRCIKYLVRHIKMMEGENRKREKERDLLPVLLQHADSVE